MLKVATRTRPVCRGIRPGDGERVGAPVRRRRSPYDHPNRAEGANVPEGVDDEQQALREALKHTAVALKDGEVLFALAGGYAAWARGGPEPDHDVDFVVTAADAERAKEVLADAGLRVEQPPEDWLFKVYRDDAMVDILFRLSGDLVEPPVLQRASWLEVLSVQMPVLAATDVLVAKLAALDEHMCDLTKLLPVARALREQIDWDTLRAQVEGNDFAAAALFLFERLQISSA
jgi:putative nucleotidyltransferase-like protein